MKYRVTTKSGSVYLVEEHEPGRYRLSVETAGGRVSEELLGGTHMLYKPFPWPPIEGERLRLPRWSRDDDITTSQVVLAERLDDQADGSR